MSEVYVLCVDGKEFTRGDVKNLQQRNAELELLLQTAEQNATEQRDMKAKAREQRDEQVKKNKELAAQVEQLRKPLSALAKTCHDRGGALQEDGQFAYKVKEYIFKAAKSALDVTPTQYLAEHDREVAARAAISGLRHGVKLASGTEVNPDSIAVDLWCEGYANKIKSGEVEL